MILISVISDLENGYIDDLRIDWIDKVRELIIDSLRLGVSIGRFGSGFANFDKIKPNRTRS